MSKAFAFVLVSYIAGASVASAQVVNPADKQKKESKEYKAEDFPQHSWELPAIQVPGEPLSELREEDRVGPYGQPRWTTHRRFPNTRIYVMPEGQMDFEYWLVIEDKKGSPNKVQRMYEFEFGLPYRFQIDLYAVSNEFQGNSGTVTTDEQKLEVRWAFADWGKIWGNPTLYGEWVSKDQGADVAEWKLLLGDELGDGWHWGTNLVWEQEAGGARETTREVTAGISKTLVDEHFSVGAEAKFAWINDSANRSHFTEEIFLGPSIQWRPIKRAHIDIAPLWGMTNDTSNFKAYIVFGWEF